MNPARFYRPVASLLDPDRLRSKRVVVVGLGSGGGRVAAELGRLGVQLLLLERPNERLEEHNIVRHILGQRSLGKLKLRQMAVYVRGLNPFVRIEARPLDVVDQLELFEKLLRRWHPDAIAVCTDNEPSKHAINEVAVRLGVPQVGGAVYDGGIGGEVYRICSGAACYGCLARQLQLQRQMPQPENRPNYDNPEQNSPPVTSALALDIAQVALLQCRLTLELLLPADAGLTGLPPEVNLCVFANRIVPGTFKRPWHGDFFSVAKRPECLVCGDTPDATARCAVYGGAGDVSSPV